VHGALEGLGYRAEAGAHAQRARVSAGKEYGNNGQCNPTYFTVGNLVQYLQSLEEQGLTKQEIIDRYVFFTAGACGPAASACTKPSTGWRCATPVSTASACCCSSSPAA
jgi:predicted nucleotide-binding protein (sugar kinase/HSP70/actin superfamily)